MLAVTAIGEQLVQSVPGGIGRYAAQVISRLADHDLDVTVATSRAGTSEAERLKGLLGERCRLTASTWPGPVLARAWGAGIRLAVPKGPVYAPSLMAPLGLGSTCLVTIHDAVPWTHPELLTAHGARWHREMGARVERHAQAVAVPTWAVANALGEHLRLGDRVIVVPGAVDPAWVAPDDAAQRRTRLGLPERYVVAVGTLEPRKGLADAIASIPLWPADVTLVSVGQEGWGGVDGAQVARTHGVASRFKALGRIVDLDLAAVMAGAVALIMPSVEEGFGLPILEAFALGVPVVHSDAAALVEVAGGAGLMVSRDGGDFLEQLAGAVTTLAGDESARSSLTIAGRARVLDFSWDRSAGLAATILKDIA